MSMHSAGNTMNRTDDLAARPAPAPALPMFWPMAAMTMLQAGSGIAARNLRFLAEEEKLHFELHPALASPSRPLLELRTTTRSCRGKACRRSSTRRTRGTVR